MRGGAREVRVPGQARSHLDRDGRDRDEGRRRNRSGGIECPPEFLSPEGYCSNPPTDGDETVTDPGGIECPPEFLSPEGYCSNPPTDKPSTDETETPATGPNDQTLALAQYLEENFGPGNPYGKTSWYDSITDVSCCSWWDGKAFIETTSFSPSDARAICTAVMLSGEVAGANVMNPESGKIAECP